MTDLKWEAIYKLIAAILLFSGCMFFRPDSIALTIILKGLGFGILLGACLQFRTRDGYILAGLSVPVLFLLIPWQEALISSLAYLQIFITIRWISRSIRLPSIVENVSDIIESINHTFLLAATFGAIKWLAQNYLFQNPSDLNPFLFVLLYVAGMICMLPIFLVIFGPNKFINAKRKIAVGVPAFVFIGLAIGFYRYVDALNDEIRHKNFQDISVAMNQTINSKLSGFKTQIELSKAILKARPITVDNQSKLDKHFKYLFNQNPILKDIFITKKVSLAEKNQVENDFDFKLFKYDFDYNRQPLESFETAYPVLYSYRNSDAIFKGLDLSSLGNMSRYLRLSMLSDQMVVTGITDFSTESDEEIMMGIAAVNSIRMYGTDYFVIAIFFIDEFFASFAGEQERSATDFSVFDQVNPEEITPLYFTSAKEQIAWESHEAKFGQRMWRIDFYPNEEFFVNNSSMTLEFVLLAVTAIIFFGQISTILVTGQTSMVRREIEEKTAELKHQKELADAANKAKSDFLMVMSHELRTPLNAVIGFSDYLKRQSGKIIEGRSQDALDSIYRNGVHLLQLINDILDISAIEKHNLNIHPKWIPMKLLFNQMLDLFVPLAQQKEIELDIEEVDSEMIFEVDERRMSQVLSNLISNAIKYTEKGQVVVRAKRENREMIPGIELSVKDSGIGIEPEKFSLLFVKFSQLGQSIATRQYEGAGLGLFIVKELVELHSGNISIESTPGVGTTFSIWIPLEQPKNKNKDKNKAKIRK